MSSKLLNDKMREAIASVLPITLIVLMLCFTITPIPNSMLVSFAFGAVMLIVGMAFFTLGADTAMTPIGNKVGACITKSRKLWVVVFVSFLLGVIITISEPDLQVLANQVPSISNPVIIGAVALGVGDLSCNCHAPYSHRNQSELASAGILYYRIPAGDPGAEGFLGSSL